VDHPLLVGARRAWAEAYGPGRSIDP
jgi:hypothetical protein